MEENQRNSGDQVKKICAIIEDRDNIVLETDVKIKYYKDAVEAAEQEIKELQKARKRTEDDGKQVDKQLDQLKMIEKSVKESQEIADQTLINHRLLDEMLDKQLDTKQQETKQIAEEFRNIYSEAKAQLTEHPLSKELEEARVSFLKVDIQRRDLEVKIRTKRRIIAKGTEIQKKLFYNFFVKMAEDYLTEKKMSELQQLKTAELEAIKKLYVIQEEVKMRQKLGTPRDKFRNMTNIIFGSQESHTDKTVNKPATATESPQPKKVSQSLNEKLNDMFERDEVKQSEAPKKVRIIENKVVVPSFVEPHFAPPEKRKARMVNLSRKWQKMIRSGNSKEVLSLSQQSDKSLEQMSQQSQLSQIAQGSQLTLLPTVETYPENKQIETPMEGSGLGKYSQDSEAPSTQRSNERESVRYQMTESLCNVEESMAGDTPGPSLSILTDQPASVKTQPTVSHPESILSKSHSKQDVSAKMRFDEPVKTVRFNLASNYQPKESKAMFGHSIFGNPFQSFFSGVPAENTRKVSEPAPNSFNMSVMESPGENNHTGIDFDAGGNESNFRSPEFSYGIESEEEQQQTFKTPDAPPFGGGSGGGFFSFGSKSMFPFQ